MRLRQQEGVRGPPYPNLPHLPASEIRKEIITRKTPTVSNPRTEMAGDPYRLGIGLAPMASERGNLRRRPGHHGHGNESGPHRRHQSDRKGNRHGTLCHPARGQNKTAYLKASSATAIRNSSACFGNLSCSLWVLPRASPVGFTHKPSDRPE